MNTGWIKLHRKILNSAFSKKPAHLSLWIHLLLLANHAETTFLWNGELKTVQPGQVLTGRKALSDLTGIPETTVEGVLGYFEGGLCQIRQQKTTKYRLITILKWEEYQSSNNKPTTNGQQTDTNKNDKKEKKILGADAPVDISLKGKKKDMGWQNKLSDNDDDLPALDLDSREIKVKPKTKKVTEEVQSVFNLFNNPAKAIWGMRELERESAKALLETYGIETLRKRIDRIEKEKGNKDPLFPLVTTPSQLLDKMPNVERYFGI